MRYACYLDWMSTFFRFFSIVMVNNSGVQCSGLGFFLIGGFCSTFFQFSHLFYFTPIFHIRLILANVSEFTTIQISLCTSIQRLWILLAIRKGKCLAFWLEKLTLGTSLCLRQKAYSMG
ncbi:uncharacterized protein LOC114271699 [Camellia sinensis]|uniref:uncharacterized protein LOC114271699 n=1 Tax=Camellia sinensis TaxID=4442 RepID=UPI0010363BCC|nr:uncharacterized protein LOC114271699 [Camellia sinensis]